MPVKILVVDDEPDLEQLIRQKFRKQIRDGEYEFLFAQNGADALDALQKDSEIALVLTDINMPKMDGLTLLSKLQEMDGRILKSVIVSAYGDMENIRSAMNRGAFDFLTKPIDLQDLETTVSKTLKEWRTLQEAIKIRETLVTLQYELNIATEIQTSILPKIFPPFPDRKEFDIYARMIPAKNVGGDFYDFFLIDKYRVGFVIGDVSGKGVPAALLMSVSKTLIKAHALKGVPPDTCLETVNNILVEESPSNMFVTALYGVLDSRSGALEFCNGGHNAPCLISKNGSTQLVKSEPSLVLGFVPNSAYQSQLVNLRPGDTFFLYTDGVTEATDINDEDFETVRLLECLQKLDGASLPETVQGVVDAVQAFASGAPQADDITCLALRYLG